MLAPDKRSPSGSSVRRLLAAYWRPQTGIFLALWLLLMIAGRSLLFRDPGTFWHTRLGQDILSSGRLPEADFYSFTCAGQRWPSQYWLCECVMAAVHAIGGLDGLLLATATLMAGLYTWVANRLMRAGLHGLLATAVMMLAFATAAVHLHVRPHLATFVFFAWTYARLCDFEMGRVGLARLLELLPVFWVWSNMHGGVLAGLGTMGLAWAGWCLARILRRESPLARPAQILALGALLLACGLTTLASPYGLDVPRIWLKILRSPLIARAVQEHGPLDPTRPDGRLILLVGLLYLVALAGIWPRWPRVTWLLPLVWFGLSCLRLRNAPLFGLAAVVALADLFPHTCWARLLARRGLFRSPPQDAATDAKPFPWRPMLLPAAAVFLTVALQAAAVPLPLLGRGWVRLDATHWPVDLLPELRQLEKDQPQAHVFNDELFGGFLIYYTPNLRVYLDDRFELYGDEFLTEYVTAKWHAPEQIEQWARRPDYEFDYALVVADSSFDRYLKEAAGWVEVRRTPAAVLYQRDRR